MHRTALLLVCCLVTLAAGDAWTPAPGIGVQPDGRLRAAGLVLGLCHYDAGWKRSGPPSAVQGLTGVLRDGAWTLAGAWKLGEGEARLAQTVRVLDGGVVRIEASLAESGPTAAFALTIELRGEDYRGRALLIDGVPLELPQQSPQAQVRGNAPAKRVSVPTASGAWLELSGDLRVLVQDNKQWNTDGFSVRLQADAQQRLAIDLRLRQVAITPLELGSAATIPRRDEVAGDGQGGWTDQGDNDLRALPSGRLDAAGRPFLVGDNAIVLAGAHLANRPRQVEVAVPEGRQGEALYLLHAAAWAPKSEQPVGRVRLRYRDGAQEEREVVALRDIADWWGPTERLRNAAIGWSGVNPHAPIGLYVSRLPIPAKPLQAIGLEVVGEAVWMVVGLALGDDAPLPAVPPDVMAAGPRWLAGEAPWEVEPGSALDLSWLTPAQPPGRLVARGARLELESAPGKPVRLLGANLCFTANYPTHQTAERMAAGLRAMGHNTVRIHHFDGQLVPKEGDGSALDPEAADRLDYLVAACRKAGLWVTTDLYVSRRIPVGAIPELPDQAFGQEFKAMVPLLPSAMQNWKRFATVFLTHKNPYTGLTWGEDPALATLSLINEDNLPSVVGRNPAVQKLYDQRFAAWIAGRPAEEQSGEARERARQRWLLGLQAAACEEMRAHVRSLGCSVPTTSANMQANWWTMALRGGFDFVDNHAYHDHPGFPEQPWRLPFAYRQQDPVQDLLRVPAGLAQSRLLDRPFTVTEVNYCAPNHRRAAYAAGVAAVAGLQGWDGVWRFAFSHDLRNVEAADGPMAGFDLAHDPIALLGERAMALLYRRGDIAPAPWAAALVYDPETAGGLGGKSPDRSLGQLALHARVGCLPVASAKDAAALGARCLIEDAAGTAPAGGLPVVKAGDGLGAALAAAGLLPAADFDQAARRVRSAGGQVSCDAGTGMLTVATPRSVAAVLPGKTAVELSGLAIANDDPDAATIVVAALEGDLATGRRLLVLHLTDAVNSGMRFASRKHTLLEGWGQAPVLLRAGQATLRLPGGAATAHALDLRGVRRESLPVADGRLQLPVARAWGPCLAWEIVRD